jgi:hypothetical protein
MFVEIGYAQKYQMMKTKFKNLHHHLKKDCFNLQWIILLQDSKLILKKDMAVDFFHPNAAPWQYFGITRYMGMHIAAHDKLLAMDWNIVVSGHEPILGTPEYVQFNKEFTLAVLDNAVNAIQTTQPSANYFGDSANKCAELTVEQYPNLKDIDVYTVQNCVTMVFYAMID